MKWNHVVFIFLRLAYFTECNVLKVHLCCHMFHVSLQAEEYPCVCVCAWTAAPTHLLMDIPAAPTSWRNGAVVNTGKGMSL